MNRQMYEIKLGLQVHGDNLLYFLFHSKLHGELFQGFWRRNENLALGQALQLIYGDNTPIMLHPGRTWVTVVRGLGNANVQEDLVDVGATATITAMTPSPTPFDPNPDD